MLQSDASNITKVEVKGQFLFAGSNHQLFILDIRQPDQPIVVGTLTGFNAKDLAIEDHSIWVADGHEVKAFEWRPQATVLPWTVQNNQFRSWLQIANLADGSETVRLNAVDIHGEEQVQTLYLAPNSAQTVSPVDLFPQLSSAAIAVETNSNSIASSFSTFALNPDGSLGAPSQAAGLPSTGLLDGIIFSFPNPIETAALVITAPFNQGKKTIHLDLFGPQGWVARSQLTVEDQRPIGKTLKDLFTAIDLPESMTVTAQSEDGTRLTGATFVFNQRRQPATSEAFSRSAVFLPTAPPMVPAPKDAQGK